MSNRDVRRPRDPCAVQQIEDRHEGRVAGHEPVHGSPAEDSAHFSLEGAGLETGSGRERSSTRAAGGARRTGIRTLYAHQLEALRATETDRRRDHERRRRRASRWRSTCPSSTRSPAIPVGARALYLYPTKALAQDQARKLFEVAPEGLHHAIYDGDTPREERPAIRRRSNLILTNPDMVHVSLLPHHKRWAEFISKLQFVVVDEAHVYRGVFGSHVANVLRRLRRVARIYGAEPPLHPHLGDDRQPARARRAAGRHGVPADRLRRRSEASRRIAMWNPPLTDRATGARRSVLAESSDMLADLSSPARGRSASSAAAAGSS